MFNHYTDVPIPARFSACIVDDLNFSSDPKSLVYGEKAGIPFAPVGIYDYTNRLVTTVESDYNGLFDVLMPSTNRINCPTPPACAPTSTDSSAMTRACPAVSTRTTSRVPDHCRRVRGDARRDRSRPTSHRPRSGWSSSFPGSAAGQAFTCPVNVRGCDRRDQDP